jgi:hypothetical protein
MPCYRCGSRQVDPDRGESRWRRGVRADQQVLICPDCQVAADWASEMDRCEICSSVHLVRRLGEVECRDCGAVGLVARASTGEPAWSVATAADLADEVDRALAKVLGPNRQRPPVAMS